MVAQENPFGEPISRDFLDHIETTTDFWNRRPQLQLIAERAEREEISPWGLLLACQVHQLSYISPAVVLVKQSGMPGVKLQEGTSCNIFGGLTAPTGGGKSATFREATALITPQTTPVSDGTGQGLTKTFAETLKTTKDDDGKPLAEPRYSTQMLTHSVVLHAPEVDTLNAEFVREGSKTASMLRSLWVGETVGSTTGDIARRVTLPANLYRIGGLWGVQPVNATGLLSGADDGTPQRWVWAPAQEFRVGSHPAPKRTPAPAGTKFPVPMFNPGSPMFGAASSGLPTQIDKDTPMPVPIWVGWSPQMAVDIGVIKQQRDAARDREPYAKLTPAQVDQEKALTMESHLILTRIKLAAALGFLWGHTSPTDDDWELAGIQLEVSRRELAGAWMRSEEAKIAALNEKGTENGKVLDAANSARDDLADSYTSELAQSIWGRLQSRPMTQRALRESMGTKQRRHLAEAVERLTLEGRVRTDRDNRLYACHQGNVITPTGFTFTAAHDVA